MTATVMRQLPSFSTVSPVDLISDPRSVKPKRQKDEVLYQESPSTFSQASTCLSRSLTNDDDSCSSVSELKGAHSSKKGKTTDRDSYCTEVSDRTKGASDGRPIVRKSRVSTYLTGTDSAASDHDLGSRDKSSVASGDTITELRAKMILSGSIEIAQNRGAFSDCSKFSSNNSKTSFQHAREEHLKHDGKKHTTLSDIESRLQKYDFSETKQSCYSKPTGDAERKGIKENYSKTTMSSQLPSKDTSNYNVSELQLKLRGRMESKFLSNELRNHNSPRLETSNAADKDSFRSIDEILRDYGIASEAPSSQYKNAAYKNLSQNNETSQTLDVSDLGKNESSLTSRPREDLNQSMVPSSTAINSPTTRESRVNSSIHLETRNAAAKTATYKNNLSQNNESKYAPSHQELLRKYGSSVDNSSIAAGGKYSRSKHYGRYDYGKSTFTGDASSGAQPGYGSNKVPDSEVKANLSRQLEGSQVDVLKPGSVAARKEEDYNEIRQTGSSIDAVEFTISNERQRLRRLNNMITSTSITTSDETSHKNLMTRYLSPQRDYHTMRASNAISRVYSSPTFPSSHYGTSVTPKGSWLSNIGEHDTSVFLGKSASVPSSWNNGFQSYTNYSTSFDTRSPYLPHYSSRDIQYNNSTSRSFSLERLAGQIKSSKNYARSFQLDGQINSSKNYARSFQLAGQINPSKNFARSFQSLKQENPLVRKGKQSVLPASQHKNYNQSRCPLQNTSNISMFSTTTDASCATTTTTSGSKKSASAKKSANRNTNDSKSTSDRYCGSGILKYLSKPLPGNRTAKTTGGRRGHRQSDSGCSSYSSHSLSPVHKVRTFHNLATELFRNDIGQASTKSKPKRIGSRKSSHSSISPTQYYGYGRRSEIVPSRTSSGQCSVHSSRTSHDSHKRILRSVEKKKAKLTSEILIKKTNEMPKSAGMHHHHHVPGNRADMYRPESTMATSSKSYPQFSTHLPYQVYRDYSTVSCYNSRPSYY